MGDLEIFERLFLNGKFPIEYRKFTLCFPNRLALQEDTGFARARDRDTVSTHLVFLVLAFWVSEGE